MTPLNDSSVAPATADDRTATQDVAAPEVEHHCDVLIADDTGHSREILAALLRQFAHGVKIREARDGGEALNAWRQLKPRVTFLDIDMPGQDGLAVLQAIREQDGDAFVAMVSGLSSVDNVRKALATGASGFIVKPYKPQRIIDVLERYRTATGHALVEHP